MPQMLSRDQDSYFFVASVLALALTQSWSADGSPPKKEEFFGFFSAILRSEHEIPAEMVLWSEQLLSRLKYSQSEIATIRERICTAELDSLEGAHDIFARHADFDVEQISCLQEMQRLFYHQHNLYTLTGSRLTGGRSYDYNQTVRKLLAEIKESPSLSRGLRAVAQGTTCKAQEGGWWATTTYVTGVVANVGYDILAAASQMSEDMHDQGFAQDYREHHQQGLEDVFLSGNLQKFKDLLGSTTALAGPWEKGASAFAIINDFQRPTSRDAGILGGQLQIIDYVFTTWGEYLEVNGRRATTKEKIDALLSVYGQLEGASLLDETIDTLLEQKQYMEYL